MFKKQITVMTLFQKNIKDIKKIVQEMKKKQ